MSLILKAFSCWSVINMNRINLSEIKLKTLKSHCSIYTHLHKPFFWVKKKKPVNWWLLWKKVLGISETSKVMGLKYLLLNGLSFCIFLAVLRSIKTGAVMQKENKIRLCMSRKKKILFLSLPFSGRSETDRIVYLLPVHLSNLLPNGFVET